MNGDPLQAFEEALSALDSAGLRRQRRVVEAMDGPRLQIGGRWLLSFCSNDYLGLSQHPALVASAQQAAARYGVGAGASPLVSGHSVEHERLEAELASFVGRERALYFYAGYPANVGIVPALVGRGDAVFSDALNHACLIDGARLSRAEIHPYPHGDLAALEHALAGSNAARRLVISDAVFSMDGDIAPVPDLLALCDRYNALLLIDDAHGFGVLGPEGRGTAAHYGLSSPRLIYMATLGKAAGVAGAFVAGDTAVVEWLLQRARSYVFATGAPPLVAATLRTGLRVMAQEGWRRDQLARSVHRLRQGLTGLPWTLLPSETAIQPLIVGGNRDALGLMHRLEQAGLWVPAIRPPTVPANTARLRISLSAAHSDNDVDQLVKALRAAAAGEPSDPYLGTPA